MDDLPESDLLKDLERRIDAAVKTIEKLKRENGSLKSKLEKLGGGGKSGGEPAWRKERGVVQKRLTQLAGNLEELL